MVGQFHNLMLSGGSKDCNKTIKEIGISPLGKLAKQIVGKSWEFGPRRGGLLQSQIFHKINQNLICLGNGIFS